MALQRKRNAPFLAGRLLIAGTFLAVPAAVSAQGPSKLDLLRDDDTVITGTLQAGLNAVAEENMYWNLAEIFAPSIDYDASPQWLDLYLKPGITAQQTLGGDTVLYGRVSAVGSATLGIDGFAEGNTGRVLMEEAVLGVRFGKRETGQLDLSTGAQELKLGTGMLIANGASNGFERGAVKLGPRKAWEGSVLAKFMRGGFAVQGFIIDPRELGSNNTRTRIAGVDVRHDGKNGSYLGASFVEVLRSDAPYVQAAPGGVGPPSILNGARDGLKALSLYARVHPLKDVVPGLYLTLDYAREWNARIDLSAWGGRVQLGHAWTNTAWRPDFFYSFQTFSGDDPNTPQLERFDPLNYEGSPASWATGSKAALVFINSNVQSHQLTLRMNPSPKDIPALRTAHVRANELRSPIQFGQATRLDFSNNLSTVIAGVTTPHLSNDVFVEHTRIITRNIFLTAGFSVSVPGEGITRAAGGSAPTWTGGFVNVVVNY